MRYDRKYKCNYWSFNMQTGKWLEQARWIRACRSRSANFKEKISKKLGRSRSTRAIHRQTALPTWINRLQHALITLLMNWQAALKHVVKFSKILVRNSHILISDLDRLWSDQALRLRDQGRKCTYKHIQWSNWSKDKGIDRIWDPIKEEELSSSPVESPVVKRVFFPLGESNLLESSSSRLETDDRANYKSLLLDFIIKTMV